MTYEAMETVDGIQRRAPATTKLGTSGRKVVAAAGTRETLVAASVKCHWVMITAELNNTGTIVVGDVAVIAALTTRLGTPLDPGDSVIIPIADLIYIYLDSTVTGDGVTYDYGV